MLLINHDKISIQLVHQLYSVIYLILTSSTLVLVSHLTFRMCSF